MIYLRSFATVLFLVLLSASGVSAQSADGSLTVPISSPKITGQIKMTPAKVTAGSDVHFEITIQCDDGWHIYSVKSFEGEYTTPTSFKLSRGPVELEGSLVEPEPKFHDGDEYSRYHYHEGQVVLTHKGRVKADAAPGFAEIEGVFGYQACDDSSCIDPKEVKFRLRLQVLDKNAAGGAGAPENGGAAVGSNAGNPPASLNLSGLEQRLDLMDQRLATIEGHVRPVEPETPPERPTWTPANVRIEPSVLKQRPGDTARLVVEFETPVDVEAKNFRDSFVDVGQSAAIDTLEVTESRTRHGNSGTNVHSVTLEVHIKDNATSGSESNVLALTLPLLVSGHEHIFEIKDIPLSLEVGSRSVWKAVLTAVVAALLALLTPCVFPMVPVTVSFFTKQAEHQQKNPLVMPAIYVFGIIASFVGIGVIFTSFAGAAGAGFLATNGYLQGVFGVLFVLFALSLFGAFTLQPPAWVMARAGQVQGKGGLIGTLGMGLLFSLTSFTCTAPLVGTLLVDAATTGEWFFPVIGMFAFSAVLALPFFFLALFPKLLSGLPRSGSWMNLVKITLGFLELAFALKFFGGMDVFFGWGVFTRTSILWLWILIFVLNGLYLLGTIKSSDDTGKRGSVSVTIGVVFLLMGLHLHEGTQGKVMPYLFESLLPPELNREVTGTQLGWNGRIENDLEGAVKVAQSLNVPLFIDFTGFT